MKEYWKISLEEIFAEYDLNLPEGLIEDVIMTAQMESEACGYHFIPDPRDTEVEKLKIEMRQMKEEYERMLDGVRKGVAERRGVPTSDVSIDRNGNVTYQVRPL